MVVRERGSETTEMLILAVLIGATVLSALAAASPAISSAFSALLGAVRNGIGGFR